jgi:predicted negative regulator of RcsB-dependent stress response
LSGYDEQEDIERLKSWWKNYGNTVIFGIVLGASALIGVRYWHQHTEQRLQSASVLYNQMLQNFNTKPESARTSGEELIKDYASTPYAGMAGLMLARMDFDAGDVATARKHLQWVLTNAGDAATEHAARLRLARLYLDGGDKDAALALLNVKDEGGFESEYEELRGDIYLAKGQRDQARAAYREALKHLAEGSPYARILNMKLDDLGPEQTS